MLQPWETFDMLTSSEADSDTQTTVTIVPTQYVFCGSVGSSRTNTYIQYDPTVYSLERGFPHPSPDPQKPLRTIFQTLSLQSILPRGKGNYYR